MTIPEMRERFKSIYNGLYDADPKIEKAAEDMLRAITIVDFDSLLIFTSEMRSACVEEGYLD